MATQVSHVRTRGGYPPASITERLMLSFCKAETAPDYAGGTVRQTADNALSFLLKTVPGFLDLVRGKSVLDFGCGRGLQALALAKTGTAASVVGVDLPRLTLQAQWAAMDMPANLALTTNLPADRLFDVVYSCSSFEHFSNPEAILRLMRERVKPGGKVVITFAEPWYSNNGAHTGGYCRIPWANLLFSERAVMSVRSRFRSDGARCYEEVEGGLNRMTVAKFERLMRGSSMRVEWMRHWPTKGLPSIVSHVPVLRELLTSACSCVLTREQPPIEATCMSATMKTATVAAFAAGVAFELWR